MYVCMYTCIHIHVVCIRVADSLHFTVETDTAVDSNYLQIKIKKKKKQQLPKQSSLSFSQ